MTTEDFLHLNREGVQECRQERIKDLKRQVEETLDLFSLGRLTEAQVALKIETLSAGRRRLFLQRPGKRGSSV